MRTLFCVVLAALPAVLLAQLNCSSLGFTDVAAPLSGADLSRCAGPDEQCCTQDYIDSVQDAVVAALRRGLAEEFEDVIDDYQDDVENLLEFFNGNFVRKLIASLPLSGVINQSDQGLLATIKELTNNYNIEEDEDDDDDDDENDDDGGDDDEDTDGNNEKKRQTRVFFNPRQFVDRLVASNIDASVNALGNGDPDTEACVRRVANSLVNGRSVSTVANQIQTIRQSISVLNRIGNFLRERRAVLANTTSILGVCVSRFIDIAFCSRCTERTPPLCFNTCNGLLRACYSPYYTALNEQYDRLWEVAERVIEIARSTVRSLFNDEASLLDSDAFRSQVQQVCRVTVPDNEDGVDEAGSRKRQMEDPSDGEDDDTTDGDGENEEEEEENSDTTGDEDSSEAALDEDSDSIPEGLVADIAALRGAFNYRREGLDLCLSSLVTQTDDCSTEPSEQEYCSGTDICTARCYCTAGEGLQESDVEDFQGNGVEEQVNNPVVSDDQEFLDSLNDQVVILSSDDPVAAFLQSSDFTSVAPEGAEGEEGNSAVGHVFISLTLFLTAAILAVFV